MMMQRHQHFVRMLSHAYLQNARPQKAVALLAALDAAAPGQGQVLRALAFAQVRSGQAQLALGTLDRMAHAAGAIDATFHLLRAQALSACGRRLEAAEAMGQCLAARGGAQRGDAA